MWIVRAKESADFKEARDLIALMAAWDITESRTLGIGDEGVLEAYYSETPDMMEQAFTRKGAGLFVCRMNDAAAGCAAFSAVDDKTVELHKMFVRTDFRGKGIGRALMSACLAEMKEEGYADVRLETVQFMREALALYRSFGFVDCDPFDDRPKSFHTVTVHMRKLL